MLVFSQGAAVKFSNSLFEHIVNPILLFFFVIALIVFVAGIIKYVISKNTNPEGKDRAVKTLFWGIIGIFLISSTFTILTFVARLADSDIEQRLNKNKLPTENGFKNVQQINFKI